MFVASILEVEERGVATTTIDVDDELIQRAQDCTGLATREAVVEKALHALIRLEALREVESIKGEDLFWPEYLEERRRLHDLRG
jgi:Arc/MetJ family transcription regulator